MVWPPPDLSPLTVDQLSYNPYPLEIPEEVLQLETDTINVLEGRVAIGVFAPDYQEKIKNFYRFSATRVTSKMKAIAKMTHSTLDLI